MGEAIRSSMSIPLAFKPMKIDTMLLYDGGIYDNFPWEPLDKEFHPDFSIGSKCTSGNNDITENSSLVDQAFSLAMNKTNYDMPEGRSLMINRAVNVSMLDFNSADSIIEAGYRDALAQIPALREKNPPHRHARRDPHQAGGFPRKNVPRSSSTTTSSKDSPMHKRPMYVTSCGWTTPTTDGSGR